MRSAARSTSPFGPRTQRVAEVLSGPVAICIDRPVLSLDRPFTYELPGELEGGVGSLVQVPFHGRLVRGWVLGATEDVPARVLRVKKLVSRVRFFDPSMLELLRRVSDRYVAPLAAVIARSHPPRVASEEGAGGVGSAPGTPPPRADTGAGLAPTARGGTRSRFADAPGPLLAGYRDGGQLFEALETGGGSFVLRPAPEDEAALAAGCVVRTVRAGRTAIVLVPEVDPLPTTVRAVLEAVGDRAVLFAGGDRRERYRTWLQIAAGEYRVVIGTRPAVFAPIADLGLVFVSRESHALHREERAPYYHVRDVALERMALAGGVCVMSALFPSLEAAVGRHVEVEPARRMWPAVEVVRPGPEGRAPRLVAALRRARRAFLYSPLPGYGVARVCRSCGEPAACRDCGGTLRMQEGEVRCAVCGTGGRCASCGGKGFGIARGGVERVEEWARGVSSVPVRRIGPGERPRPPGRDEVLVGGVEVVKDLGVRGLDLVGILDADLAARRPGLSARERALAAWFEAAAWASPDGRVIVQTEHPNDPGVQALVSGRPDRFARAELPRRAEAGFPVGSPVLRVVGSSELAGELSALRLSTLLVSSVGVQTVCLVALDPEEVTAFGRTARELAERGVVTRVEAEPHL